MKILKTLFGSRTRPQPIHSQSLEHAQKLMKAVQNRLDQRDLSIPRNQARFHAFGLRLLQAFADDEGLNETELLGLLVQLLASLGLREEALSGAIHQASTETDPRIIEAALTAVQAWRDNERVRAADQFHQLLQ